EQCCQRILERGQWVLDNQAGHAGAGYDYQKQHWIKPLQSTLPEGEQVYFSAPLHFPPYDVGDHEPGENEEKLHEYHGAGEPGQLHVGEQYTEGHPAPHTVQSWVIADLIPVHLILSCSAF